MYEFTEDCMIHIEEIDNEHRRLFQMINEAIDLAEHTEDVTTIADSLLPRLKEYAATHFAHEEAYMESINDPELPLQRKEHTAFTEKMNTFVLDTSSPEAARTSLNDLLTYLVRWLYHHILSSDIMIGKCVKNRSRPKILLPLQTSTRPVSNWSTTNTSSCLTSSVKSTDLIHEELLHDKYDEIMRLLAELRQYTEFHFSDEEALMEQISYPGFEAQKRAHSAFVERLVEIDLSELDAMDDNQQEYLVNLIDFLLAWLSNHILGSDKKIGDYIRTQHLSATDI